jgi:ribonuclease P protein component
VGIQREFRLKHSADFARLRKDGESVQNRYVLVSYGRNTLGQNRYGFITSKRLGNAVQRNRIRRLLRESVRKLHPSVEPGWDVVLIARSDIGMQPFTVIQRTVNDLFTKAGLVKGNVP